MSRSLQIGARRVGPDAEPFFIAEMSGNHNASLDRALEIVDAAADAGAHAVKLQTYTADTITLRSDAAPFRIPSSNPLWPDRTLWELYDEAHTPWAWHEAIFARAAERGIECFSSPFDPTAVDLLESLGAPAYKVASFELVDLPLIRRIAETGKPVVVSTGMASVGEIAAAVDAVRSTGNDQLIVLGCTSEYPAEPSSANLRSLPVLASAFDTLVGLSDHTPGIGVAVASVAFGACFLEKHMTIRRADGGVDSAFSLEPEEVAALVRESKAAWEALGSATIGTKPAERGNKPFRRSLYVSADVRAGDVVSDENVRSVRPAGGLPPDALDVVRGRRFTRAAALGTPLTWDLL